MCAGAVLFGAQWWWVCLRIRGDAPIGPTTTRNRLRHDLCGSSGAASRAKRLWHVEYLACDLRASAELFG